jgi:capsular polysaccharide biosynthesis protein
MKSFEYLLIMKRRAGQFVAVVLLSIFLFSLIGLSMEPRFGSTVVMTFAIEDTQETEDYKYTNFYAEQAALEFTRTISGWYKDPSFTDHVFKTAEVDYDAESTWMTKIMGYFAAKRVERQNIRTTFSTTTEAHGQALFDGLKRVIQHRLDEYNAASNADYVMAYETHFVEVSEGPWKLLIVVGLMFGLVLGLFVIYIAAFLAGRVIFTDDVAEVFGKTPYDILLHSSSEDQRFFRMRMLEEKPFESLLFTSSKAKGLFHGMDLPSFHFPNDVSQYKEFSAPVLVVIQLGNTKMRHLMRIRKLLEKMQWQYVVVQ